MKLVIDEKERISLDGNPLRCVTGYSVKHPMNDVAELTVSLVVKVNQVASVSEIYLELVAIRKELQAIRSSLEPKNINVEPLIKAVTDDLKKIVSEAEGKF
jgi:hypothetical protein